MSNREVVSTIKAAQLLGVSQQSVRKWCQNGMLKAKSTPGGFYKIEMSELERFKAEFNMPALDTEKHVLIVEEDPDRTKFFGDLLEMLDLKVVTALNPIEIGISIGRVDPELILLGAGTQLAYLLQALNECENNTSILVITEKVKDAEDIITLYKKNRKIGVLPLSDHFDVQQFKSTVKKTIN